MRIACFTYWATCVTAAGLSACAPVEERGEDAEQDLSVQTTAKSLLSDSTTKKGPTTAAARPLSWPGGNAVSSVDASGAFASNLSGLFYNPATIDSPTTLWAVQNSPSKLYRLLWDGSAWTKSTSNDWGSGKTLHYPGGAGSPDAEAVTRADLGNSALYVASERNNEASAVSRLSILEYDPEQTGNNLIALREWNLTADLPSVPANSGLEGLTFVPDALLVNGSFLDEATNVRYDPSRYPNHAGGLFFVGLEGNGLVYAYALNHSDATFRRIATIASGNSTVMDLTLDRDTGALWAYCDNSCSNVAGRLAIDQDANSINFGRFTLGHQYSHPTQLPNANNEGVAIAPDAECVNGMKLFLWADDSATEGHSLRAGSISCQLR